MGDSSNEFDIKKVTLKKSTPNNFEFTINSNDIIFVLTRNNSIFPNSINNMISKIFTIKELTYINLDSLSEILSIMGIDKLNIIDIKRHPVNNIDIAKVERGCLINYVEINPLAFSKTMLNDSDFLEKNKYTLYLLRDANFSILKLLFSKINDFDVNVCKGNSQKSHLLSPLDLRLSTYIMALFNYNSKKISYLNKFNDLSKDKYLSWSDDFKAGNYKQSSNIKSESSIIRKVVS